jgi:hypothetical protein
LEMCRSGVGIGMAVRTTICRRDSTPVVPHLARPACFGVAVGSTKRTSAERRIATTAIRRSGPTSLDSVPSCLQGYDTQSGAGDSKRRTSGGVQRGEIKIRIAANSKRSSPRHNHLFSPNKTMSAICCGSSSSFASARLARDRCRVLPGARAVPRPQRVTRPGSAGKFHHQSISPALRPGTGRAPSRALHGGIWPIS